MISKKKRLVKTLRGETHDRIPFWFMRQAGRYLPEYKKIRSQTKNFMEFCYSPDKAAEVTLQPITRFGMDGAIIFSDILVIPHSLGVDVRFEEGKGPILSPVRDEKTLKEKLAKKEGGKKLEPVYEALRKTKAMLPEETALIGFAGAPWTLACYTVNGGTSQDYAIVKSTAANDKAFFLSLIEQFSEAVIEHAGKQIEAGAEIFQLFDSWAGILNEEEFEQWVIVPTKHIVASIKKKYPEIPLIGFPRMAGEKTERYLQETKLDAISFDGSISLSWVKEKLQPLGVVQGALDNQKLASDKIAMLEEAEQILHTLAKPFVFNLGHGILPHTPIENVQALCEFLKKQ
jgi:uroporphyrinogen decarboxylase